MSITYLSDPAVGVITSVGLAYTALLGATSPSSTPEEADLNSDQYPVVALRVGPETLVEIEAPATSNH